ncbi:MAG: hypothetical protein ACTSVE_04040, partial [Candidatus Helarchaeota archaeon]
VDAKCYWIAPTELGYYGNCEIDIFLNNLDQGQLYLAKNKILPELIQHSYENKIPEGFPFEIPEKTADEMRTKYSKVYDILRKLKAHVDPKNVSNPPFPFR